MLAFRDRLRTDDDERRRYEEAKRELAARDWTFVQHYADAKSELVEGIIARALAERDGGSTVTHGQRNGQEESRSMTLAHRR